MGQGWPQHQDPERPIGLSEAVHQSLSAGTLSLPLAILKTGRPAPTLGFKASKPDYSSKRLGREPGNCKAFVNTPAVAPTSFVDHLQQLALRPEGLIARTLVQPMPPHDHNAHQSPGRKMLPARVFRAGLVALSRQQIFRSFRPRFRAVSS